ncbi:MAG: cytochrome c biogenesis protein CcsA [Rhodospirillales bacterium]|nr:cytochrome c biogenesis protein CcsA [Rhodospirillales bacterium]MCB9973272.1 cytochrome c biogenesis protein CcsA [Rhodospirillales bacterium]MCB9980594.1 cytochrome c biogenesis protein CcsA [Rhodospirillales bacterium]
MQVFSMIPLQHDGRVKPLESFARHMALRLTGTTSVQGRPAIDFLAEALFDPTRTAERPLFTIRNPEIKSLLGLPEEEKHFSLTVLLPGLQKEQKTIAAILARDDKSWSHTERALITLYETASDLRDLVKSLHFILPLRMPLPEFVRAELDIPASEADTYLDLKRYEEKISTFVRALPEEQVSDDLKLFILQLSLIEQSGDTEPFFRIMPPEWPLNQGQEWLSPWILINSGMGGPESAAYLDLWKDMAVAYRAQDTRAWQVATEAAYQKALSFKNSGVSPRRLVLETRYQQWNLLFYSFVLFGIATACGAAALSFPRVAVLRYLTAGALIPAVGLHATALCMRVMILERPPVSTLYESVLFVSLICVATALVFALFQKNKSFPLFLAAVSGVIFSFLSGYLAKDGDTLQVLVAVLNTNFWLATHVTVITAGYGLCVLTAMLAHGALLMKAFGKDVSGLTRKVWAPALISLLLTSVGTILGGVWADQSWGRFWGWDPKENGALLIVLWLVWVVHGKISGHLKETGFLVSVALLNVIVALAWFGVNLLSVGLHSYGFISGIAWGLGVFCTVEAVFVGVCGAVIKRKSYLSGVATCV